MTVNRVQAQEPIAIVGIGCRFPGGANSPDAFWQLLANGVDAISEVPEDRWSLQRYFDPTRGKAGKTYTKWGGFLDKVDEFDAQFFGISPREASMLDPQQRLLLEVCWEALEDGGQVPDRLRGSKTGVFIGGFTLDYKYLQFQETNRQIVDSHTATGAMMTLLANRLSYVYDFQGPSIAVDTACSSSLVAVHMACQSLWTGESKLAVAGGVNVMLKPDITIAESKAGMLSPDGRSKAFDSRANGYVRGEGAGIVILKPLSEALADGDSVYAVIRGTACNQDGNSAGLTVPRGEAQQNLMREAYARAGVEPREIQYVEAHGTGTPVGDPIEANALGTVLSDGRPDGEICYIASVKTNFGHTEAAAGIAGLIKAALSLKHGQIPQHLHLINPNPEINFEHLKLRVPQELTPWPAEPGMRLAGVNSFGFGGTNAHVVLQDAPVSAPVAQTEDAEALTLVPLSARSRDSLRATAESWVNALEEGGSLHGAAFRDITATASSRRSHHPYRLGVAAKSKEDLAEKLRAFANEETRPGLSVGQAGTERPPLVFVYTGMGPQWWGMGQQLYREEPVFRNTLDGIDVLFRKIAGWSLLEEMLKDESASRMAETEVAQPANFYVQVGLTELWRSYGIQPDAIVGHSAGEAASAYVAGAMSLEEAVKVIYHRSRLQQLTTGQGRLVAVSLSHEEAKPYLHGFEDRVSVAAINSPGSITLVGDPEALDQVVGPMQENGVFCKYLFVKVPYHSHYMDPLKDELLDVLKDLELTETALPLYSTVTGNRIEGTGLDANYWWLNVRDSVYFAAATEALLEDGYSLFVEVGPHAVLAASINECLAHANKQGLVTPSLRRGQDEQLILLGSLGVLYTQGYDVNWTALHDEGQRVKLPTYPWQHEHYWNETKESRHDRLGTNLRPLLGARLNTATPVWETEVSTTQLPYLVDHQIQSSVVFPGAGYYEMVNEGITDLFEGKEGIAFEINGGEFHKALFLTPEKNVKLQLAIDPQSGDFRIFDASNKGAKEWPLHCSGNIRMNSRFVAPQLSLADLQARINQPVTQEQCYLRFRELGLEYGPTFQGIHRLWQSGSEALARIKVPDEVAAEMDRYEIHPSVFDLMFQALAAALPFDGEQTVYMPTGAERAVYYGSLRVSEMWVHTVIRDKNAKEMKGDIRLLDGEGNTLFEIFSCRARSLKDDSQSIIGAAPMTYTELAWKEQELPATDAAEGAQGKWVILADRKGHGGQLAAQLTQAGGTAVLVQAGDAYEEVERGALYTVKADAPEDYQRLLSDLQAAEESDSFALRGLVHLFALDIASTEATTLETLEEAERLSALSLLHLTQATAQFSWRRPPAVWVVTSGSQSVAGEPIRSVGQSSLWGLVRVMSHQEHRDITGGIVELDPQADLADAVSALAREVQRKDREDQVAFRDGTRYVARLLDNGDLSQPITTTLRADGSYMITGGFGALGLLVARYLIERGARRLILVGREELPPRAQWKEVEANSRLGDRIRAVRELEALGASVHVTGFDVSDQDALARFVAEYEAEGWPRIRGIIHSAGTSRPQMLLQMSGDEFRSVMRPKVQGAWNLHRQFADQPLDFFILFSSVAALLVSPGQGNYSAGNEFLDALARHRHALGLPALSINWGPWGEIGMATQLDLVEFFVKRGNYPIANSKGLESLGYVMGHNRPQVMVSPIVWPVCCENNYPLGEYPAMLDEIAAAMLEGQENEGGEEEDNILDRLKGESGRDERIALLESHLQDVVARVLLLNRSKLTPDQSLSALGLDSMLALELKGRLEKAYAVNILVVDLMRGPTLTELANSLLEQMLVDLEVTEETAELIEELGDLSLEELEKLLAETAATEEGEE